MKVKRLLALTLTAVLLVGMVLPVSALSFPDVTERHDWAKPYIDDMVERGLLKGYPDGTFKPDNSITKMEALILSARILGFTDESNQKYIDAAYAAFEDDLAPYDLAYAQEVAYLLNWNVLKLSDLPNYVAADTRDVPIKRHEAAILLTKVMGEEDKALGEGLVILDFADADKIPAASKPYVQYVNTVGIMKGMEDNTFDPDGAVTRAQMATMMARIETAMDVVKATAVVQSVNAAEGIMTVVENGTASDIAVPEGTSIKVDGTGATLLSLVPNMTITIRYQGEQIRLIEAVSTDIEFVLEGTVYSVSNNNGARSVGFIQKGEEDVTTYPLAGSCDISIDGSVAAFTAVKKNMYATITVKGNEVIKLAVEQKEVELNGTISAINLEGEPTVTIKRKDDTEETYGFLSNAVIRRNNSATDANALSIGDSVKVVVQYGAIKSLTATSSNRTAEGSITQIVISSSPSVSIQVGNNVETYAITKDTVFTVDQNDEATIYDLRLGATATVKIESSNVKSITTETVVAAPQIIGIVTYLHPTSGAMGIAVTDAAGKTSVEQVVVKSSCKVIDNTSTKITDYKKIEVGRSIIAVGSVNYGVLEVNNIIITQ